MTDPSQAKIPIWVNVLQVILTLVMLQQVYLFYLDHQAVAASGITIEGVPNLNLLYEFAARTAVMAVVSITVIVLQNPRYFLVVLLMNILREGQEIIIDPLFPLATAPMPPVGDFVMHLIIVAIEIWAFITVFRIVRRMDSGSSK